MDSKAIIMAKLNGLAANKIKSAKSKTYRTGVFSFDVSLPR